MATRELRRPGEDRFEFERLTARERQFGQSVLGQDSVIEPLESNNVMLLLPKDYPAARLSKAGTVVRGVPGAVVRGQWVISGDLTMVDGLRFVGRGSVACVRVIESAHVIFRDCTFELGPGDDSEGVNVDSGCKVHFDGCIFTPALAAGTGQPIAHAGVAANVRVTSCINVTTRAHGAVTTISELT